jgi:hypothetical protein
VYGSGDITDNQRLASRILDLEAEENSAWEETVRAERLKSQPGAEHTRDVPVVET